MRRSLRPALVLYALALLSGIAGRAEAQHCHAPLTVDAREYAYRAYTGFIAASYGKGDGNYQGFYAGFAYRQPWWGAELRVPTYRLQQQERAATFGLGDIVLSASGTALKLRDDTIQLGAELPLMLPTGSASRSLGMGHPMLMPALWLLLDLEPVVIRAQLGYGRVLGGGDMDHHHHEGVMRVPLVNPMNRSEIEHALIVSLGLARGTSVHLSWLGAAPVDDPQGVNRQVLAAGASARFDPIELGFELQRPVAGDPFFMRLVLELTATF
ncbi:MAG: hypothetical protein ABW252_18315 [Polyangiales bacterium]